MEKSIYMIDKKSGKLIIYYIGYILIMNIPKGKMCIMSWKYFR